MVASPASFSALLSLGFGDYNLHQRFCAYWTVTPLHLLSFKCGALRGRSLLKALQNTNAKKLPVGGKQMDENDKDLVPQEKTHRDNQRSTNAFLNEDEENAAIWYQYSPCFFIL